MTADPGATRRSAVAEYFKELSEAMTRDFFPGAGYSIKTFYHYSDDKKSNLFTVLRYETAKHERNKGKWFGTTEFPPGFEIAGDWLSLSRGNEIIFGLGDQREVTINEMTTINLGGPTQEYRWSPLEFVYSENAEWCYGIEKPATMASFSTNGSFPPIEDRLARRFTSDRLESFIWFNLVSDKKMRPTNCKRYSNPSVLVILPHFHGLIESVSVEDSGITVRLASDVKTNSWDRFGLTSKEYYHGGMESDLKSVAIDSRGVAHLESSGPNLSSVEVELFYQSQIEDEGFWVDKTRAEKRRSRSNMNLEIHEFFDMGSGNLEEKLFRPETDAISFEWAVATLLHLAGYQVDWLGFLRGKKGSGNAEIDIIASGDDDEGVLAVECTVAKGDLGRKIQSVAAKSVDLTSKLSLAKVTPVVCTPLGGEQLKAAGFEHGQSGSVRILSGSDLSRLLGDIKAGVPHKSLAYKISTQFFVI